MSWSSAREGALIHDVDGNTLIDLAGGIGMIAAGHCPPPVVDGDHVAGAEVRALVCAGRDLRALRRARELLNELDAGRLPEEDAAREQRRRGRRERRQDRRASSPDARWCVCFEGGYHGRTLLTLSLTSKYGLFKSGFGPFAPEIVRLPIPQLVSHARAG